MPNSRDLARLRLAAVLLDEKAYDEALKQLEREPPGALRRTLRRNARRHLAAQGKRNEAKAAYQDAIARIAARPKSGPESTASAAYRELLQAKLDALGDGQ